MPWSMAPVESMGIIIQNGEGLDGSVETQAFPKASTATQSDVLGQEIPVSAIPGAMGWLLHAALPPGSVEVNAWPLVFTAAQKELLGHEMPEKEEGLGDVTLAVLQVNWPAAAAAGAAPRSDRSPLPTTRPMHSSSSEGRYGFPTA